MSKIDYDISKIKGIVFDVDGVLSPSTCPLSESGKPIRMGNVKDGYALQLAVRLGLKIAVITGGSSVEFANRMKLLGIKDFWQNVGDKLPVLKKWIEDNDLSPEEVAYMGDDIPDLRCLRYVGLPTCPFDAAWEVKQESTYISTFTGGYGAARDIIREVMSARGLWNPNSPASLEW